MDASDHRSTIDGKARRKTLFAKGNLDVRDSLHSFHMGDALLWNGIADVLRNRDPGCTVRVRHETCTRFDAVLAATGEIPAEVAARNHLLGPFSAASQFSRAMFAGGDAVVLSIQPDLTIPVARHRSDTYLLHPYELPRWPDADRRWLRDNFAPVPMPDADTSMRHLAEIVERIRGHADVPILVFNVSSFVPGDSVHCYQGFADSYATRIRRYNLALIELSADIGISIIDVDRIVAEGGAQRLKLDTVHLTAEGCRRVAADVVRVLDDHGWFPSD